MSTVFEGLPEELHFAPRPDRARSELAVFLAQALEVGECGKAAAKKASMAAAKKRTAERLARDGATTSAKKRASDSRR